MPPGYLFSPVESAPEPPRRKRRSPWDKTDSIALIACDGGGNGCVLAHDGAGIEADFEHESSAALDNHGLDDAPEGLSIWEGRMDASKYWTDCGYEYDASLEGTFRDLTPEEWELYRATGVPWTFEDEEIVTERSLMENVCTAATAFCAYKGTDEKYKDSAIEFCRVEQGLRHAVRALTEHRATFETSPETSDCNACAGARVMPADAGPHTTTADTVPAEHTCGKEKKDG